ncbi:MAG: hypothetical protein K0U38_00350 [Epsilonproteobacteria bacterium]|nr:hypothetical protein [Campylobacterota bacterium]
MKSSTKAILGGLALGTVVGVAMSKSKTKGAVIGGTVDAIAGAGMNAVCNSDTKKIAYKK